jgi:riboflavin kinase/FMN adenylyltransferase
MGTDDQEGRFRALTGHDYGRIHAGETLEVFESAGRAYALKGKVVEGNRIGRTLGYPTANLEQQPEEVVLPGKGVYTALVEAAGGWHQAMVNIGIRPTLDMYHVTIEAHLLGFSGNLYGKPIAIHFLQRIRDEMRFSSLSALRKQLDRDREKTLSVLKQLSPRLVATREGVLRKD